MSNGKRLYGLTAVLLIIGGVLVALGLKGRADLLNAKDITELTTFEEGAWVKGVAEESLGGYMVQEKKTLDGETLPTYRWFLVYFVSEGMPNGGYIGVRIDAMDTHPFMALQGSDKDSRQEYAGRVRKCEGDVLECKKEFLKKLGNSYGRVGANVDWDALCPDYYIEMTTENKQLLPAYIGAGGIFLALLVLIAAIVKNRKYAKLPETVDTRETDLFGRPLRGRDRDKNRTSVGAASGFNFHGEKDELSQILEDEDQKVTKYNLQTGLAGSDVPGEESGSQPRKPE